MPLAANKADQAAEMLDDITVDEWDERLTRIAWSWKRAYGNRQLRAEQEGNTAPPPSPPWVDVEAGRFSSSIITGDETDNTRGLDIAGLVNAYQSEGSPLYRVGYTTRRFYESLYRQLVATCGSRKLAELNETSIREIYAQWTAGGTEKIAMASSQIYMLRRLCSFGAKELGDGQCERIIGVLSRMEFEKPASRFEHLTEEQVKAICEAAHRLERPSIALAQAFQFQCPLKQKDVIGEWVPQDEDGKSEILHNGRKWLRGLRWNEIVDGHILRRAPVKGGKLSDPFDLHDAPMVMKELELAAIPSRKRLGPVIVNEGNNLPWFPAEFRRWWRKIANEAGVPLNVKNMDSRLGRQIAGSRTFSMTKKK